MSGTTQNQPLRILWGVDALDPFPEVLSKITSVLQNLAKKTAIEVTPTCMISPDYFGLPVEFTGAIDEMELKKDSEKALSGALQDLGVPELKKPLILFHHHPSLRGSVEKLARYAEEFNYDMIVVATHGRKGLDRAVLGSFTENLIFHSKKPVLIVGPNANVTPSEKERILIPNDLAQIDSFFFPEIFRFARRISAAVTFFHSIPKPAELFVQSGVYLFSGVWMPILPVLKAEKESRKRRLDLLKEMATKEGLTCDAITDGATATAVDAILNQAKEQKSTFIALESKSSAAASTLMGSIARKVIRDAPCPVWVLRSKN